MRYVSTLLSVALLTAGLALADAPSATARDQLRDLRGEARQVRSAALYIERISAQPSTTWKQMDKQWNEIKPQQEAMMEHLSLLEAMTKSMTPAEVKALNVAKPQVKEIAAHTHEIRMMLDQKGVDLQSPKFKMVAHQMAREASEVAHGVEPAVLQTASR